MGKKQKKLLKQYQKTQIDQEAKKQNNNTIRSQQIAKLSKKEKKKLKKDKKSQNNNTSDIIIDDEQYELQQKQVNENKIEIIDEQVIDNNEQISESLIQISSSQIKSQFDNEVDLNPRGKQGFEQLMEQKDECSKKQIKSIQIKRRLLSQQSQQQQKSYFIFHLKKQTYYKVTSLTHQKLNTTHLNQTISLKIIDQNLLKYGNKQQNLNIFLLNGKLIQKQIQFIKSTVFKVISNSNLLIKQQPTTIKQNSKDKKKNNIINNLSEKIKINIQNFIKPSTITQTQELIEFLRDFQWNQDCLLIAKQKLVFNQTNPPFSNIDPKVINSNNTLLILGKKNSGKSTLAEYLKNTNSKSMCILDCDIGRSLSVSGCVSLLTEQQSISLWIGQFTPFNCIQNYVAAIKQLYQLYRQKYFSKKLIINTMGYLSGLGEMIIYEIYNLINPSQIIVLNSQSQNIGGFDNMANILKNIKTGSYLSKLLTLNSQSQQHQIKQFIQKKLSLNIQFVNNQHAQSKGIPIRFENLLMYQQNIKSIIELIKSIKKNQFQKLSSLPLYEQDKLGNIIKLNSTEKQNANMRIILIGKLFQNNKFNQQNNSIDSSLFRVFGIGFGFQGNIYFSKQQIEKILSPKTNLKEEVNNLKGIISEGIDFQKNFYLINQFNLINFELEYGNFSYILPIIKGMGSKGTRNNPSKNA